MKQYIKNLSTIACLLLTQSQLFVSPEAWAAVDARTARLAEVNTLATKLKIATFRGSLTEMSENYTSLTTILSSTENASALSALCNYFCHYQLANYHLFRATDYPYLLSKPATESEAAIEALSPDEVRRQAADGISIIDRGIRNLYRQQSIEADDSGRAFREFTRQAALLNSLKVKLYMVAGDAWYQSISDARVRSLDQLVTKEIGANAAAAASPASETKYASAAYEQASWTLIEMQTDIPASGPEFASIRSDIAVLTQDIETRLKSLRKGHLFINIDPEAFTNISVNELQAYLKSLYDKVKDTESQLDKVVKEYSEKISSQSVAAIEQKRIIQGQSMDLSLHKIAALEAQANLIQNNFTKESQKIETAIDTGETRRNIRQVEFELQKKLTEYDNAISLIKSTSEQDLLAMSKASQEDRRQELRWLIDYTLATLNLELQVKSFEIQSLEYDRQIANNKAERGSLEERIKQRELARDAEKERQSQAELEIQKLRTKKDSIFSMRRQIFAAELSGINNRRQYFDLLKQNQDSICTLRATVADKQSALHQKAIDCIKGGSCDDQLSREQSIKAMETVTAQSLNQQISDLKTLKTSIETRRDEVQDLMNKLKSNTSINRGLIVTAEGVYAALTLLPKTTLAFGLASFTATEWDLSQKGRAVLDAVKAAADYDLEMDQIKVDMAKTFGEFATKLDEVSAEITRITDENKKNTVSTQLALSELMGQKLEAQLRKDEVTDNAEIVKQECLNEISQIDREKENLKAEEDRIQYTLDWETGDNNLIDSDIAQQQAQIVVTLKNMQIIDSEIVDLRASQASLVRDSSSIDELKKIVKASENRISNTRSEVDAMAEKSEDVTGIINELNQEMRRKALAIQIGQEDGLKQVLSLDTKAASAQLSSLNVELQSKLELGSLKDRFANTQADLFTSIQKERENVVEKSRENLEIESNNQRKQLQMFLASEQGLADIVSGVPNFIENKRRSLDSANYAINLLRGRVRAIRASSVNPRDSANSENAAPKSYYLKSGADFENAMTDLCGDEIASCVNGQGLFFAEDEVIVAGALLTIPVNSDLVRTLQEKGRASFRITPKALSDVAMKQNGYFEISLPAKITEAFPKGFNASLLGIRLASRCSAKVTPKMGIRHMGTGSWFEEQAGGNFVPKIFAAEPRFTVTDIDPYDNASEQRNFELGILYPLGVGGKTPRIRDFDSVVSGANFAPKFLGLPLFGRYELVAQPTTCLEESQSLQIGLIFSLSEFS